MGSVTELVLPTDAAGAAMPGRRPMMVVDGAHVTYRVYASGKKLSAKDSLIGLRALRGGRDLTTVPAVRGVSFTASEGETVGVIGHNGSGKSTLFRAMSGLLPTSQGTIWAADRPVLLGVNAALVPELSGENNIKLGLLAMGFSAEEASAHVDEIADFAELNEFIHHPMRTYSSGMGARLRFAIASAKAHSILLIDEALAVGDRRFRIKSEQRIRDLRDSAGLVMIVSHSAGSLRDTCERVLWIHKGELRADGPADDVLNEYTKWVQQPGGGAVGAASVSKAEWRAWQRARTKGAAAPAPAPTAEKVTVHDATRAQPELAEATVQDHAAGPAPAAEPSPKTASPGPVAVPEPAAVPMAVPTQDADPQALASPRPSAKPAVSLATQPAKVVPVPRENPRDVVRRERYRRQLRERTRRKVTALAVTGGAILLAVGAGAGIALVTLLA